MKKVLGMLALASTMHIHAQLVPNGNSGSSTTAYTNGAANDPIYIWCGNTLGTQQGSLTATPTSGTGPYTFNWYYHDETTSSWQTYTTQSGTTSTVTGLPSDGYRVEILDASSTLTDCFVAWVWNLNTEVTASNSLSSCNNASLTSTVNTTGSFNYYNPPPPQSIINSSTNIQVCFSATHTYVSDLAFYLVGPPSCGSPTVLLSPNPGAIGQNNICNSGDNVSNLCFSNTSTSNMNVCTASVPLTGNYGTYGPSSTAINWSSLIGCNAASGGWKVQIYDCISADVGSLTSATITFSNLTSYCGSSTSISYSSGSINSAINDNSCTASSASIFAVPVSTTLSTPITITANTTLLWTASPSIAISNSSSTSASASGLPAGTTTFTLTATSTYGSASCSNSAITGASVTLPTVDAGPAQSLCSGGSVTLTATGAQSYSWDNGLGAGNGFSVSPSVTTTYTVTGTAANGCSATDQVTISVGSSAAIDAGSNQSICPGGSVTLTGSGGVSYSWDNGISNGVAFTPASTQTYTVTGTDVNGCTGTDQVTVTVNSLPAVDAGSPQSVCQGVAATLTATGAQNYTWDNGLGAGNGVSVSPSATTTYMVTGTDANGCSATDQVTITVNSSPVVDAGSNQAICPGGSVTLNGSGAQTYSWNNGVTNGVSFSPASTQTYTVTGTNASGCTATDQVTVTVNSSPVVDAGSNQAICPGGSVTLNGSGAQTYSWNNGVTNGVSFTPASTQTYTVTGTDANGCTGTDQVTVTVNPNPTVDAGSPQTVCQGVTVILSGSGAQTYTWDNGVTNGTAFTPASTQTYTVTGTDGNGCTGTDQVTVTVNPLPNVDAGLSQSICDGSSVTLSGSGAQNYSWDNGITDGTAFTPSSTLTYTVTGTDANGCSAMDQVMVTVNSNPVINAGMDQTICNGYTVTLSGSGGVTYSWDNGVYNGVSFSPSTTTTYTVTGTDGNGCTGTDQVEVTVLPAPVAGLGASGSVTGYPGLEVTFINSSQNASTYDFDYDNGNGYSTTYLTDTPSEIFNTVGSYTIVLTISNGYCSDTAQLQVVVLPYQPVSVVVPNIFTPNGDHDNDEFFVRLENAAELHVTIVNRWGEFMAEINEVNGVWDGTIHGDPASDGVYFYKYEVIGLDGNKTTGQGDLQLIR